MNYKSLFDLPIYPFFGACKEELDCDFCGQKLSLEQARKQKEGQPRHMKLQDCVRHLSQELSTANSRIKDLEENQPKPKPKRWRFRK